MYSTIALIFTCAFIWFLWIKHRKSYKDLALYYLWITPFFPVISLFNHNLDHDVMHPYFRMIPFLLVNFFMLISFNRSLLSWKSRQFWCALLALSVYAVLTLLQVLNSTSPYFYWSIITWSWIVPGCILFLIAGYETPFNTLIKHRYAFWVVLGVIVLGLSIQSYALHTGRVGNIWYTRNMGGPFANGIMISLLYGGIAWLQIRDSFSYKTVIIFFILATSVSAMSRSALFSVFMIMILLFSECQRNIYKVFQLLFVSAVLLIIIMVVLNSSDNSNISGLLSAWANRLHGIESIWDWAITAVGGRLNEFQEIYRKALYESVLTGVGFAQFYFASGTGYRDAHNMFINQCYENGLLAAMFLYVIFCMGIVDSLLRIFSKNVAPLSFSIILCMILIHTGGYTLYSNAGPTQYFHSHGIWVLFFMIGHLMQPLKKNLSKLKVPIHEKDIDVRNSSTPYL